MAPRTAVVVDCLVSPKLWLSFFTPTKRMDDQSWIIDDSADGYNNGLFYEDWIEASGYISPWDDLQMLFWRFDEEGFGEMTPEHFRAVMYEPIFRDRILHAAGPAALRRLELRTASCQPLTYAEFVALISNKRRLSFARAVNIGIVRSKPRRNMVKRVADRLVLPEYQENSKKRVYLEDESNCWPPPIFIPFVTLVQIGFFLYYSVLASEVNHQEPVPADSFFVYRADKRTEIWRYFFYVVLHAGWVHLAFNLLVQVIVGVPLELIHGGTRVALVYMSGVLAGSLGTTIFDRHVVLVGASGGVYALLAAHIAHLFLNFDQVECACYRLFSIFLVASADLGFAIWNRYIAISDRRTPISYVAHAAGALAGLTVGLVVLRGLRQTAYERCVWWCSLLLYAILTGAAVAWNIIAD